MYVFEVLGCGKANYNYFDTCANQWIRRNIRNGLQVCNVSYKNK